MSKRYQQPVIAQSPLVRLLSSWSQQPSKSIRQVFSARLADEIDISAAIELSDFFKLLPRTKAKSKTCAESDVGQLFNEHRDKALAAIDSSMDSDAEVDSGSSRLALVLPRASETLLDDPKGFQSYRRFYELQQSELERRVVELRNQLVALLSADSDRLAQLIAIDRALEPVMTGYGRRCFARIPSLLADRFEVLRERQRQQDVERGSKSVIDDWSAPSGWWQLFCHDLQALLHAECAMRFRPLQGLVLAINNPPLIQDAL